MSKNLPSLIFGLLVGIVTGLLFGLSAVLLAGKGERIRPTGEFKWSWKTGFTGVLIGLFVALVAGLSARSLSGLVLSPVAGTIIGLPFVFLFGLSPNQLVERTHFSPNERVRRSGKNGLFVVLLFGLSFGLFFGLIGLLVKETEVSYLLYTGHAASSSILLTDAAGGLLDGLIVGLLIGLFVGSLQPHLFATKRNRESFHTPAFALLQI